MAAEITIVDDTRIKNKKIKGCIICQNPEISSITDPIIFKAECDWKTLKDRLQSNGFYIDVGVISNHSKHVFYDDNKEQFGRPMDNSLEKLEVDNSTNLDIVKDGLANLLRAEKKLIIEGKEGTKEYLDIITEKRRLIELKAKLEGELEEGDTKCPMPQFIKLMEDY